MQLSRRSEYALLALIDMAVEARGGRVQLRDMAERQGIPEKYLEQLLRPLKTAGVVLSTRGSRGGYQLAREPQQITVLEVLEAVEGPVVTQDEPATEGPAAGVIRHLWQGLTGRIRDYLAEITLARLAEEYGAGRAQDNWVI